GAIPAPALASAAASAHTPADAPRSPAHPPDPPALLASTHTTVVPAGGQPPGPQAQVHPPGHPPTAHMDSSCAPGHSEPRSLPTPATYPAIPAAAAPDCNGSSSAR